MNITLIVSIDWYLGNGIIYRYMFVALRIHLGISQVPGMKGIA